MKCVTKYIYLLCREDEESLDIYGIYDSNDKALKEVIRDFYGFVVPKDLSDFYNKFKINSSNPNKIIIMNGKEQHFVIIRDILNKNICENNFILATNSKLMLKDKDKPKTEKVKPIQPKTEKKVEVVDTVKKRGRPKKTS